MRRWLKWIGVFLLALMLGAAALFGLAWQRSEAGLGKVYAVADPALQLPVDAAALAHGKHLFETRGCTDCHGDDAGGRLVMDAGPLVRLVAPNITPAKLAAAGYDADTIARAVRHGLRADGRPLLFMPAGDWSELSDADTAALVAHMGTLPDSANDPGKTEVRPLARLLYLFDKFPLIPAEQVDHRPRARGAPAPAVTAEFGAYVVGICTGCHGKNLAGGPPLAPNTPAVANLTPSALGAWSEADFLRAMREGKRPDGSDIDPFMPWKTFARLTDIELRALWLHLQSLPPTPTKA